MCLRGYPVIVTGGDYYGCQELLYQKDKNCASVNILIHNGENNHLYDGVSGN